MRLSTDSVSRDLLYNSVFHDGPAQGGIALHTVRGNHNNHVSCGPVHWASYRNSGAQSPGKFKVELTVNK